MVFFFLDDIKTTFQPIDGNNQGIFLKKPENFFSIFVKF